MTGTKKDSIPERPPKDIEWELPPITDVYYSEEMAEEVEKEYPEEKREEKPPPNN